MIEVTFLPSPLRPWANVRSGPDAAHVIGWAFTEESLLKDEALGRHIMKGLEASLSFADILARLNGNFAVVVQGRDIAHLGVDGVRSIPLFFRRDGERLTVSDDARRLMDGPTTVDRDSAIEFAAAGMVTGSHTLFREITGMQAGQAISLAPGGAPVQAKRYYSYRCSYDAASQLDDLCRELDDVLVGTFRRLIDSLDGRQAVLPLSGGLDSRLVAAMFRRIGYEDVICYSYGVPGNLESRRGKEVAEALGYRWIEAPYSRDLWREVLGSDELTEYRRFAANGVSFPYQDDWPAVRMLGSRNEISDDAVFVPGHTGDFICGGHLKYLFDPYLWNGSPHDFNGAMVKKHYSLWSDFAGREAVRTAVHRRLDEATAPFPRDSYEDLARMYEYWEWQERQSKFIINSVRTYEFFGFSWRVPLWDRHLMDFWRSVPIALKMREYLYRRYLTSYDPLNLFAGDDPGDPWRSELATEKRPKGRRRRLLDASRRLPPVGSLTSRYERYRRHLREWKRDPREEAHAYRKLKYLLFDSGKRHVQSLALRDFLRAEYGLEMSDLSRGKKSEITTRRPRTVGGPRGVGGSQWS